jgi:hypothetical protein
MRYIGVLFLQNLNDMLNTSPDHFSSYSREKIFLSCAMRTLSPILNLKVNLLTPLLSLDFAK